VNWAANIQETLLGPLLTSLVTKDDLVIAFYDRTKKKDPFKNFHDPPEVSMGYSALRPPLYVRGIQRLVKDWSM